MTPRVLLDCDGVLADFQTRCLQLINEITGWSKTLEDMRSWDIFEALGVPDDVEQAVYDRMHEPGWCESLDPYPGAVEGVKRLREIAKVYVITSPMRGKNWHHERDAWLWKHFKINTKSIGHVSAKYIVAGDILVDDKISNLEQWYECHPHGRPILWHGPSNQHQHWLGLRVDSWEKLHEIVLKIERLPEMRMWRSVR